MATYVIGDIHGCFAELQELLATIKFNPQHDTLWFTGDLVNGGPQPAEVIRFIMSLGDKQICVLGNHDLVLLSIAAGAMSAPLDRVIGFEPVLEAEDHETLLAWMRQRPVVHFDPKFKVLLVHAGVLPSWDLQQIQNYAREIETILRSHQINEFLHEMYGNLPDVWDEHLTGWPRIRFLINCFSRMRFCTPEGKLDLMTKGGLQSAPPGYFPWFKIPSRRTNNIKVIFGHWAALLGKTDEANAIALDTGCVWGNSLTALRLDDWQLFSIASTFSGSKLS